MQFSIYCKKQFFFNYAEEKTRYKLSHLIELVQELFDSRTTGPGLFEHVSKSVNGFCDNYTVPNLLTLAADIT